MQKEKVDVVAKVAKNFGALFISALLAKGGGLFVTILIARYLGASSLGIYAVLAAIGFFLELTIPFGQQEVIVRAISKDKSVTFKQLVNGSTIVVSLSLLVAISLLGAELAVDLQKETSTSLHILAVILPIGGLNLVAQSVLQGLERMEYQMVGALTGRILGLLTLWALLQNGGGIWSAFIGRGVFLITSLIILYSALLIESGKLQIRKTWRPSLSFCKSNVYTSLPFAVQRLLTEGLNRINIIILPLLLPIESVGFFSAAYQISQAASSVIPIVTISLLPVFSRTIKKNRSALKTLSDQPIKILYVVIILFVIAVVVSANKIIFILYGNGYETSATVLRIVIWSQLFIAIDSILKLIMIANHSETVMVRLSVLGVMISISLTIVLGLMYDIVGIAVAIVIASAFLSVIDLQFVEKNIHKTNLAHIYVRPFLSALIAGSFGYAIKDWHLLMILPVIASMYLALLLLFNVFTKEELQVFNQLIIRALNKFKG